jgi:hypothetical protein
LAISAGGLLKQAADNLGAEIGESGGAAAAVQVVVIPTAEDKSAVILDA